MTIFDKIFSPSQTVAYDGFTDWHSHILPGVDDGVENISDSLSILSEYERMGVSDVWLTPHVMEDIPNRTEDLREKFEDLVSSYGGEVKLHLAAENMMDSLFLSRLDAGDVLPIGEDKDMLLVETSYFNPTIRFKEIVEEIQRNGFTPLIAHPERYAYVGSLSEYGRWKDAGCKFQLNILSLTGHYGPYAKEYSQKMLKGGFYDFAGTDIHRPGHVGLLKGMKIKKDLAEILSKLQIQKL